MVNNNKYYSHNFELKNLTKSIKDKVQKVTESSWDVGTSQEKGVVSNIKGLIGKAIASTDDNKMEFFTTDLKKIM